MPRYAAIVRLLFVIVLCVAAGYSQQQRRALPLNRFADSRSTGTDTQGFYRLPTGIGDDYWDGSDSIARVRRHMDTARRLGVKYLRCAFSWNGIEHQQGTFHWKFWDRLVAEAERAQIRLIPYVAYTPEWAARSRIDFWKQPPRDPTLYATFMGKIAARYRGRILSWELWNEPDIKDYWLGSREEFGEMARQAAMSVRRADPGAVIVLGGMSRGPSDFFKELVTQDHILEYVDVVAMHAYPESWDPERAESIYFDWVGEMHALIAGSGVDFWLNEIGYPDYRYRPNKSSKYGGDVYYDYEHTRRYGGVFLFKSFIMALATRNTSLASWYRIDDFPLTERRLGDDRVHYHLGVVDAKHAPKPAFRAFQFFNRLFGQPIRTVEQPARPQSSQAIVNVFDRKDGAVIVAAWLRSSESQEVTQHTGMLWDRRVETVSIDLPCRAISDLHVSDAFGNPVPSPARMNGTSLSAVSLRGGSVFVASARCEK